MSGHQLQRATVYYSGQVQGVGFRYTASAIARRFDVTGFVRNLADGRVELVAEGQRREVEAFLAAVREHFASHIRDELTDTGPATGEFHRFQISH
jgi:acylphosphatase